jgi:hypothetical protein
MIVHHEPTRLELDHWCNILSERSGCYHVCSKITGDQQKELRRIVGKRFYLVPKPKHLRHRDIYREIYITGTTALYVAMMVLSGEELFDFDMITPLTLADEHKARAEHGGAWPWEKMRP